MGLRLRLPRLSVPMTWSVFVLAGVRFAYGYGEDARAYCVEISAAVSTSPPTIVLSWRPGTAYPNYVVLRRGLGETDWGSALYIGNALSYTDTAVSVGSTYEYGVWQGYYSGTNFYAVSSHGGRIYAGIEAPLTESRGKVILLVDNTVTQALHGELARLQYDLVGDGWTVLRYDIPRSMTTSNVRAIVQAAYDADTNNVKSLFIFGRVPIPFSGASSPDLHGARAMPSDLYYAELYGTSWTDTSVSNTTWGDTNNWNVPYDGKPDQNYLDSAPELECGRVDLSKMTWFTNWSETALLQRYLNKDHAFRHGQITIERRGIVYDAWTLGTAADGFRNFSACVGYHSVTGAWWGVLRTQSYLWAYSCGYGTEELGSPPFFVTDPLQTVFTMRFGSWSVDWEDENNQMRCVLASGPSALTCSWSGGPYNSSYWYYHPMGLGFTAGHCARYTADKDRVGLSGVAVYMQLLGDPTLRMHPVLPPSGLTALASGADVVLQWQPSGDTNIRGYHLYRSANPTSGYVRINSTLLSTTNYTDVAPPAGTNYYMLRAIKLEQSASGTYFNPSQGIFTRHPGGPLRLVVNSAHGSPQPAAGTNLYALGTDLSANLPDSPVVNGLTQYVCTGWSGTGSVVPSAGTSTNTPLLFLTEDSTLTWLWQTNYWLQVNVSGDGQVNVTSGWYAAGTTVEITASPIGNSRFMLWSGSGVPPEAGAINPLTVTMDRAREITANFGYVSFTTNTLPFVASFEQYPPNFQLPGTDGWCAVAADAAVVSTNPAALAALSNYTATCGFPLATNHTRVMYLNGEVTNLLACPTSTVIWIDMLILFELWDDTAGPPPMQFGQQWALYARTNGHLVLGHRRLNPSSNTWTELDATVETDRWHRITVKMDYGTVDTLHTARYFQIDLDGRTLSNALAYTVNDGSGATGGTWFALAENLDRFSELIFAGIGHVDDLVVTTNNPRNRVGALGTPAWWLWSYGFTNDPSSEELVDADLDGMPAWQEFLAGTNPTNWWSALRFTDVNPVPGARFPLSFSAVPGRLYDLLSTTNLLFDAWATTPFALSPAGPLQGGPLLGTAETATIYVEPTSTQQFYRIRLAP